MDKEAAVITTAVTGFIAAVIGLLVAFNINVTPDQQNAIIAMVVAFSVLVVAIGPFIRSFVFSKSSVETIAAKQYEAGLNDATQPPVPAPPATNVASNTNLGENVRRS